jgi:hypothetical protein
MRPTACPDPEPFHELEAQLNTGSFWWSQILISPEFPQQPRAFEWGDQIVMNVIFASAAKNADCQART